MEDSNEIFLAGGDALVYLAVPLYKKYKIFHNICLELSIKYVRILGPIFQPPRPPPPHLFPLPCKRFCRRVVQKN